MSRSYFPLFKEPSGEAIRGPIRCPRNLGLSYNCAGGEEDANKCYLVALALEHYEYVVVTRRLENISLHEVG
jgi:hypothetical protein